MSTRSALLAALTLALATTACQPPAQEVGPLSDEDVAAITQTHEAYVQAMVAGDWATFAALYTEDAVFMPPNRPAVEGRAAIQAMLEPLPPFAQIEATIVQIDGRDDVAFVRGAYSWAEEIEGAAEPITGSGKYVQIWRKQPDGAWLIAGEIWNSDQRLPEEGSGT